MCSGRFWLISPWNGLVSREESPQGNPRTPERLGPVPEITGLFFKSGLVMGDFPIRNRVEIAVWGARFGDGWGGQIRMLRKKVIMAFS
jgi:hypothetical protein